MSSLAPFIAICVALFIGCVSPGPSFLMIATTSLHEGRKAGWAASLGMGIVGALYATAAALGLAALLESNATLYMGLKIVGALYLAWLAYGLFRHAKSEVTAKESKSKKSSPLLRGLITQASNPKTIVVYGSIFAAFMPTKPDAWLFFALPIACGTIEFFWYAVVTNIFTGKKSQAAYLKRKAIIDRIAGVVMLILATYLVLPH